MWNLILVKWEYIVLGLKTKVRVSRHEKKNIIQNVQKELNVLGEEGWELVGVQIIRLETGMLFTVAYLKRKKL